MNTGHLDVARDLLRTAERFERWSKHDRTEADVEAGPKRAALARQYARAAFALVAAAKFPAVGSGSAEGFQGLEK